MKPEEFCDECCYEQTCDHDLEKCCYLVGHKCMLNNKEVNI